MGAGIGKLFELFKENRWLELHNDIHRLLFWRKKDAEVLADLLRVELCDLFKSDEKHAMNIVHYVCDYEVTSVKVLSREVGSLFDLYASRSAGFVKTKIQSKFLGFMEGNH